MRLWVDQIVRAAGADVELVRVPDERLPADLAFTGAISQHLLADATKARQVLGWTHGPVVEAVGRSVAWHLEHPPGTDEADFAADDRALRAAGSAARARGTRRSSR
jgi:hypothetical protein